MSWRHNLALCAALTTGAGACGDGQIEDLCKELMRCEGGNENDREACYEQLDGDKKAAGAYGCDQRFSDWMDCLDAESECMEGRYSDDGQCDDELAELETCKDEMSDRAPIW